MRNSRKVLSIGMAALLGLTACSSASEAEPGVEPTMSSSPSVEAVAEPEATPSEESTPIESSSSPATTDDELSGELTAEVLREMPVDDYLALNTLEREPLIQEMLEESVDLAGYFGEDWQGDTSDLYKYNPLEIASKDNTPKEIAMQHLYWTQLGLMQTEDLGLSSTFDPDLATKALAGGLTQRGYGNSGREHLTDGMNGEMDIWRDIFANLGTFTNHQFAHDVTILDSSEGKIRDAKNDRVLKTVTMDFKTEELPETLGKDYQEGATTQAHLSFVWNEEVARWQSFDGYGSTLPGGEGYY